MVGISRENQQQAIAVAKKISDGKEEILLRWEKMVRRDLIEARHEDKPHLRNSLPAFIEELAKSLNKPIGKEEFRPELDRLAKEHAEHRADESNYTLEHVIKEYEILRKVIFDYLEETNPVPPYVREIILDAISSGTSKSAVEFAEMTYRQERESHAKMRESQELFETVFELAAAGKAIIDAESGKFLRVNQKLCSILGYTAEELKKKSINEIIYPGDINVHTAKFKTLLEKDKDILSLEKRYVRKDGRPVWVLVSVAELPHKENEPFRLISTVFDISARKLIEERLMTLHQITEMALSNTLSSQDLINVMLDHTKDSFKSEIVAILLADPSRQYLIMEAERGLEYEKDIKKIIPVRGGLSGKVFLTGKSVKVDDISKIEIVTPGLKEKVKCALCSPLFSKSGTIGVVTLGRIKAEPYSNDDVILFELVCDRIAAAMENAQLYNSSVKTINELKAERKIKEQFVNTLTHDLRTPLSAIKIGAQLLLRKLQDPSQIKVAERIIDNVVLGDRMIQDLLDTSRITAGEGIPINIELCDLVQVIKDTVTNLSIIHGDRFLILGPESITGYWYPSGLRRIVENLCSNAIKYGSKDQKVTLNIQEQSDNVVFSVHNLGEPMTDENLISVFEEYKRTKSAEQSGILGWGIGLAIVKALTEAHCGNVRVTSTKENGTTFTVTLPRDMRKCKKDKL